MGLIRDEPNTGSQSCGTTLDDGTEDGILKVEESVDRKEENPKAKTFPQINTEAEVSGCGLCVRQQQFMLYRPFTAINREYTKVYFNSLFMYSAFCISYYLDQQMHSL
jgi:hypothetical protein